MRPATSPSRRRSIASPVCARDAERVRRFTAAFVAAVVLACACTTRARADDRTFVALTVNTQERGDALAIIRADDVLVSEAELRGSGIVLPSSVAVGAVDGDRFVSLASLRPAVSWKLDVDELRLDLTVDPALLERQTIDLRPLAPPDVEFVAARSAFLNYVLNQPQNTGMTGSYELSASNGIGRLYATALNEPQNGFMRGYTAAIWDDRATLRRTTIGDAELALGDLGSNPIAAGVTIERAFALDPYHISYPTLGYTGAVTTPSTADVYVNGVLLRRIVLQPGTFEFSNLPVPTGSANTQVVIRDAFGNDTQLFRRYYAANDLLKRGTTDYSYTLGFPRTGFLSPEDRYGDGSFLARYRLGLTDWTTLGGRFEAGPRLASGGPLAEFRLPAGQLLVALAGSDALGARGSAATLAYSYVGPRFGFDGFAIAQSRYYARADLLPGDERPLLDAGATVSYHLSPAISLTATLNRRNLRDGGNARGGIATLSVGAGDRTTLALTGTRSIVSEPQRTTLATVYATLTYAFGDRGSVAITNTSGSQAAYTTVSVQRPPPFGNGFGYALNATNGSTASVLTTFLERAPFGEYSLDLGAARGGTTTANLLVSGAVATMGHEVLFSRPIDDGFVLVQTRDAGKLPVYVDNHPIGVTSRAGLLLLPDIISNVGNRVSVVTDDVLPLNVTLDRETAVVAPAARGGMRVVFTAHAFHAYAGTIVVDDAGTPREPAYGRITLRVAGKPVSFDLGAHGEFYMEDLRQGRYPALVEYRKGRCRLTIDIPAGASIETDLGTLHCAAS